jgi:hypothetical protein
MQLATSIAAPSLSGASSLHEAIDLLARLDLGELRSRWRRELRSAPPAHLNRSLLLRVLAYRMQARAYGDLDRESVRYLDRIAMEHARRRSREARPRRTTTIVPPVPAQRGLKPGVILGREFGGQMHMVTVLADGFSWDGKSYKSLSEIARAITGTRWSGPRFFGLREREGTP